MKYRRAPLHSRREGPRLAPEEVQQHTDDHTDEQAGDEWEVDRDVIALVVDVPRQPAEPRNPTRDGEQKTHAHEDEPENDQPPSEIDHGSRPYLPKRVRCDAPARGAGPKWANASGVAMRPRGVRLR